MIINPAQQVHGPEEIAAATAVLENGHWAEGAKAQEFKGALGEYLDRRYVVLTNSGSSANLAALLSLTTEWIPKEKRLFPGDEVITTALCFPTTVAPIVYAGCKPVFVDVEPGTWNINPDQVREMIGPFTKAIMVAHNLGNPFNLDEIMTICEENGLWLIEDNCDALGSEWDGRKTGSIGHIGTSSFYPAHHISTGEGGAVYTNDSKVYSGIRSIVNWGRHCWCEPGCDNTCGKRYGWDLGQLPHGYDHKNTYSEMGFNLKMTDIQAAIGVEQLKRIDVFGAARRYNHLALRDYFALFGDWFELPQMYDGADPSWFGYVVKLNGGTPFDRDTMVQYLEQYGIRSRAFFCGNITRQPVLSKDRFAYRKHPDLNVSDDLMHKSFWIGVHPGIGTQEREYMIDTIHNFLTAFS